jgi:hypothetical protein
MSETAADLARRLAAHAEDVCRHYLSNGCREGRTWRVGDVDNTPGRSLCVQLAETSSSAAGRWIDFATGEHGDLLDLIARACRLDAFRDVLDEARRFLGLPETVASQPENPPVTARSPQAARRLFASAKPIRGTIAETYLRNRGIVDAGTITALRFHAQCWYRAHDGAPRETWPALIAAVTGLDGRIVGAQRTWLARDGSGKAPLATPRRAMGQLAGNGVRFRTPQPAPAQAWVIAAGEWSGDRAGPAANAARDADGRGLGRYPVEAHQAALTICLAVQLAALVWFAAPHRRPVRSMQHAVARIGLVEPRLVTASWPEAIPTAARQARTAPARPQVFPSRYAAATAASACTALVPALATQAARDYIPPRAVEPGPPCVTWRPKGVRSALVHATTTDRAEATMLGRWLLNRNVPQS